MNLILLVIGLILPAMGTYLISTSDSLSRVKELMRRVFWLDILSNQDLYWYRPHVYGMMNLTAKLMMNAYVYVILYMTIGMLMYMRLYLLPFLLISIVFLPIGYRMIMWGQMKINKIR